MLRTKLMVFAVLAVALALPNIASAQVTFPATDVFRLDYFDNLNVADATVRITNPGTTFSPTTGGDLCAMIYVYRSDQELAECCGCKVTPNGLLKLSVINNLTSNPANGQPLKAGVIEIISALPATNTTTPAGSSPGCDPGGLVNGSVQNLAPTPALRAWGSHVQDSGAVTETAFQDAALSQTELTLNQLSCIFIEGGAIIPGIGSGTGLCSCTNEASAW